MAKTVGILFISLLLGCSFKPTSNVKWQLYLDLPSGEEIPVLTLPENLNQSFEATRDLNGFHIDFKLKPGNDYIAYEARLESDTVSQAFLSLVCDYDNQAYTAFNFNGVVDSAEIFRQSPHDVNAWIVKTIAMQAVPVIALKSDASFQVAVSDSPFRYQNFTTQAFYPEKGLVRLSSGDNARTPGLQPDTSRVLNLDYNAEKTQIFTPGRVLPYYHQVGNGQEHVFRGIIFEAGASDTNSLRKEITTRTAEHFSNGRYKDYFGALAYTTAYYNLRANDSGKSKYWVIPAVEYGNTQYGRDAFWISMMLDPGFSAECIKSELTEVNHFAEYPLFAIIWAYRAISEGLEIDLDKVQAYVDAVEDRVRGNAYYSYYEGDGRLDFQYWGDVMAFEKDDIIAYNQGLFTVAIKMAKKLGLSVKTDPEKAKKVYIELYDDKLGYLPVSMYKAILSPDAIIPDLLSQLYLKEQILSSTHVRRHYDRMIKHSRTEFGFKVVATPFGEYLAASMYDIPGYESQVNRENMPDGQYFRGGSYFLYDNLFLITAYLHGVEEAQDLLKWRVGLDFRTGSTTYETLNTITGEPWKPNMGWNVAIYAIWRKLVDDGRADPGLFESVNEIVMNNELEGENNKI